mmetsp:Transcript_33772/g.85600  ORF Transcript_33772/g.85600 Transcript_33772/m.85600 type:complete len:239 (+) Transcript_33772:862-1578(+)
MNARRIKKTLRSTRPSNMITLKTLIVSTSTFRISAAFVASSANPRPWRVSTGREMSSPFAKSLCNSQMNGRAMVLSGDNRCIVYNRLQEPTDSEDTHFPMPHELKECSPCSIETSLMSVSMRHATASRNAGSVQRKLCNRIRLASCAKRSGFRRVDGSRGSAAATAAAAAGDEGTGRGEGGAPAAPCGGEAMGTRGVLGAAVGGGVDGVMGCYSPPPRTCREEPGAERRRDDARRLPS